MAIALVSINALTIKQPSVFDREDYALTKSGRVASGKMKADIIARKGKWVLAWEVMTGPQIETVKAAIQGTSFFFPLVYNENNVEYTATVYAGALKRRLFRTDGIWYWTNVSFDLIEQ